MLLTTVRDFLWDCEHYGFSTQDISFWRKLLKPNTKLCGVDLNKWQNKIYLF